MSLLHLMGDTTAERKATRETMSRLAAEIKSKQPPAPPKPPKPHLVRELPKTASRLCQEIVLGLESENIPYTYVHPSQLHITYAERRFVLDARSKENKWYVVRPNGLSAGYHLSSLERFLQSVNRFNAEFAL